jgi:hypothetical protein
MVDRRLDPRRYDAARATAAFSVRLHQQVDLDTLAAEYPKARASVETNEFCDRSARRGRS